MTLSVGVGGLALCIWLFLEHCRGRRLIDKVTGWYAYCENAIHASIDALRGM